LTRCGHWNEIFCGYQLIATRSFAFQNSLTPLTRGSKSKGEVAKKKGAVVA